MGREPTFLFTEDETDDGTFFRTTSDHFELPALSPCSHLSVGSAQDEQEAITPTISATGTKSPTQSNFSLPRRDCAQSQRLLHERTTSQASASKEPQGFTLSPSMLIPTDYQQEMLAHQNERFEETEGLGQAVTWEEPTMTADGSNLFVPIRASNSTTASAMSSRSNFDRHISTTSSTNTDYTRMTMSTGSVNIEDYLPKDDAPRAIPMEDPETQVAAAAAVPNHARSQSIAGLLNSMDSRPLSRGNHSSDPNLDRLHSAKRQVGRGRSRTLSSSPPPPGQYALFPRPANLK
ncbi:putative pak-box p21-rho-binding protein [Diaporthe ampelina]|uniref:Putative pak-box p21-rho-binding protein n=1 Tax=Diaporthe ampelina TaxID=1214573 RepID=A0A0G2FWQ1_9PEZI|nr:putative pak-box p21-rho-binding protein [Diaporthe ampelina]